jgi:hypothetical protein
VNNLLSFAGDQKEEYCPASIRDILSDTLDLVERQIIKNNIIFSVDIPSDLPEMTYSPYFSQNRT